MLREWLLQRFAPDAGNDGGTPPDGAPPADTTNQDGGDGGTPLTFDAWLAAQDDAVKGLLDEHTKGLKSALQAERQQRNDLAKQLRDASKAMEEGSAARTALEEMTGKLEQAERRAQFLEDAMRPDVGCANPRAAFVLAVADDLFDARGNPDWNAIKQAAPELFPKPRPPQGNAGAGTGTPPPTTSVNDAIRRAAGRF
jgi:hypothetical protein